MKKLNKTMAVIASTALLGLGLGPGAYAHGHHGSSKSGNNTTRSTDRGGKTGDDTRATDRGGIIVQDFNIAE